LVTSLIAALALTVAALIVEAAVGYPQAVYRAIGHPVTWMGWLIDRLDRALNRDSAPDRVRRAAGVLALLALLGATFLATYPLETALAGSEWGVLLLVILASSLLAQRSLHDHVRAVQTALAGQGLEAGRQAVSMIVGRNTAVLDEAGVSRAAIESLAENFADGVVAPAFWMAAGGLTGAALYKAANTADSMIGHRTPKHRMFGWAAARFDDVVNLPASRLAALWIVAGAFAVKGASATSAWTAVSRDASHHRSPNAGWPEAAMAGALGLALAGPRVYGAELVDDAFMGDGRREANAGDIGRALRLYRAACAFQLVTLMGLVVLLNALR
jgi:adenosylcobinamide-phosphate synthase